MLNNKTKNTENMDHIKVKLWNQELHVINEIPYLWHVNNDAIL